MKINHELIIKNKLASLVGMRPGEISHRLQNSGGPNFTDKELEKIKSVFEDMFCYIFECDEVEIIDNKIKGTIL